jgi:hypothetical protein
MESMLLELLDALDPHSAQIADEVSRYGLERDISFGVYLRGETPAAWFGAETIRRVAVTGATIDIDLMLLGEEVLE